MAVFSTVTLPVLLLLIVTQCRTHFQDYVNVTISLGIVTGLHMVTSIIEYYSFRGIPYANVTQRFKPSTPIKSWDSVIMATDDGPGCIQTNLFETTIALTGESEDCTGESEDCLFLNVYSPHLLQLSNVGHPNLPVMLFIHGSGFIEGASSSYSYGPEFFMAEKNTILVTINYRLGVFGFLSTSKEDAPGNVGMKDQVLALKWIQKEITYFGGDPSRVTIFGESSGSASVMFHMVSPMSKGLFHRAIAQSGSVMYDVPNYHASLALGSATRLARSLYCNTENATTIVNCLSRISTVALVEASADLMKKEGSVAGALPVIETVKFGEDVFLTDSPRNLFVNLQFSNVVPLIIGVNKDEGMFFLSEDDKPYESLDKNLQECLPLHVKKQLTPDQLETFAQQLRKFYFNGKKVDKTKLKGYIDLLTDQFFVYPTVETVRMMIQNGNDVYLYNFAYLGDSYKNFWPNKKYLNLGYSGVSHGEELAFLFYSSDRSVQNLTDINSSDYKTMKKMIKLWTTFARTGYLASGCSLTDLRNNFRVGRSTAGVIVKNVCDIIWKCLAEATMPQFSTDRWQEDLKLMRDFQTASMEST